MKATGIVRRIDDLGRVVIPKEIRRTMRIREGDPRLDIIDTVRKLHLRNAQFRETVGVNPLHINGFRRLIQKQQRLHG